MGPMIVFRFARLLIFVLPLALSVQIASAQQRAEHLEDCAPAEKNPKHVRIRNGCKQAVSLIFWRYSLKAPYARTLEPGETFEENFTGDSGWWMSTVCPFGYDPDPEFRLENTKAIVESTYSCVSKQISLLR
jgi:hypothetical protein